MFNTMLYTVGIFVLSTKLASCVETYEELLTNVLPELNGHRDLTWNAGVNERFMFHSYSALKSLCGTRMDKPVNPRLVKHTTFDRNTLPKSFDARHKWKSCKQTIGHIRDQANCGSCWAVSAAEVASDRTCIAKGKNVYLSAEELLACCTNCGYGCSGGFPIDAQGSFVYNGLVTGGDYGSNKGCQPYTIQPCSSQCQEVDTPTCMGENCRQGYPTSFKDDLHFGTDYYYVEKSEEDMMNDILTKGPIQCVFTVYEDFFAYEDGVYKHVTGKEVGGHAIKVLGWGVDNDQKFWLVANSWGGKWGMSGYFKIAKGVNESGIEHQCVACDI